MQVVTLKKLLDSDTLDVNEFDEEGRTAAHYAACTGSIDVCPRELLSLCFLNLYFLHFTSSQVLAWLISADANVNLLDNDLQNTLHLACKHNEPEVVEYLLSCGQEMDLNAKDMQNRTPLMLVSSARVCRRVDVLCDAHIWRIALALCSGCPLCLLCGDQQGCRRSRRAGRSV